MRRTIEAVPMGSGQGGNMLPRQIALLTFSMALLPSVFESVSAEECLTTHQQLLEKKVSDRWKELHQKKITSRCL